MGKQNRATPVSKPPVTGPNGPQDAPESPQDSPPAKPDLGDGFIDAAARRPDGWLQPGDGHWVFGRLLGRYRMNKLDANGKERWYYQIEVYSAWAKAGVKDGDPIKVQKGHLINADERAAFKGLRKFTDSDGVFDLYLEFGAKEKIDGARTFWPCTLRCKPVKAPTMPLREPDARDPADHDNGGDRGYGGYDGDDIPF